MSDRHVASSAYRDGNSQEDRGVSNLDLRLDLQDRQQKSGRPILILVSSWQGYEDAVDVTFVRLAFQGLV